MGIIRTINSGSAVIKIDDGCCAGLSAEERARRWAEVDRAIWRINRASAGREAAPGDATPRDAGK